MVDPNKIQLSPEQQCLIAERATQRGRSWQSILAEALMSQATEEKDDWLDTAYMARCAEKRRGQKPVSLERVRDILSKIPGSMADDIIADREGR